MQKIFRPDETEEAFDILFGEDSQWVWPFWEDDLISSGVNLFIGSLIAGFGINFFALLFGLNVEVKMWQAACMAVSYLLIAENHDFIKRWYQRRKIVKNVIPVIENTEAFLLLMEGVHSRKRGVIKGFENKKKTESRLRALWRLSFQEANQLATHTNFSIGLDKRPIAERISDYHSAREEALKELESGL